jgi:hypothetical protein
VGDDAELSIDFHTSPSPRSPGRSFATQTEPRDSLAENFVLMTGRMRRVQRKAMQGNVLVASPGIYDTPPLSGRAAATPASPHELPTPVPLEPHTPAPVTLTAPSPLRIVTPGLIGSPTGAVAMVGLDMADEHRPSAGVQATPRLYVTSGSA